MAGGDGVVGDHDDGLAELVDGGAQEGEDLTTRARVEVACRLVGEDQIGPGRQGAGDGDALLLATGELARAMGQAVAEADGLDDRAQPRSVGAAAGQGQQERDVLLGVERRQQVVGLEHEPDPLPAEAGQLAVGQVPRSTSPMKARPEVSVSRPARQCINVLLPDPDGPITAVKRSAGRPTVTASERTAVSLARSPSWRARHGRRGEPAPPMPAATRGGSCGERVAVGASEVMVPACGNSDPVAMAQAGVSKGGCPHHGELLSRRNPPRQLDRMVHREVRHRGLQGRVERLWWDDLDLSGFAVDPLDDETLRVIEYMHDVEHHTVCYLRDLLVTPAHNDPAVTTFLSCWAFEELWHGEALGAVLAAHGRPAGEERIGQQRAAGMARPHPAVHLGARLVSGG